MLLKRCLLFMRPRRFSSELTYALFAAETTARLCNGRSSSYPTDVIEQLQLLQGTTARWAFIGRGRYIVVEFVFVCMLYNHLDNVGKKVLNCNGADGCGHSCAQLFTINRNVNVSQCAGVVREKS